MARLLLGRGWDVLGGPLPLGSDALLTWRGRGGQAFCWVSPPAARRNLLTACHALLWTPDPHTIHSLVRYDRLGIDQCTLGQHTDLPLILLPALRVGLLGLPRAAVFVRQAYIARAPLLSAAVLPRCWLVRSSVLGIRTSFLLYTACPLPSLSRAHALRPSGLSSHLLLATVCVRTTT